MTWMNWKKPAGLMVAAVVLGGAGARTLIAQENPAPSPSIAKDSRCFEMRTYHAAPGKLEALHARFRNHTNRLFRKHGMTLVGYWVPQDKDKGADDTLVYILALPSRAARDQSFQSFAKDPEWVTARNESEKEGKLVEKVDSVFLRATDYSPMK